MAVSDLKAMWFSHFNGLAILVLNRKRFIALTISF